MWSNNDARILDAILDELIPPRDDGAVPGAGALHMADFFLTAHAHAVDPVGAVNTVLEAVQTHSETFEQEPRAQKVAILKLVETAQPDAFGRLVRLTYLGYYSRADIRPHFGVGAHPVHPHGYRVAGESADLMLSLTAPVRARGQVFRNPPEWEGAS